MTSNLGARQLKDFGMMVLKQSQRTIKEIEKSIEKELKKTFTPEFLNRIDEVIIFNNLKEKKDIRK